MDKKIIGVELELSNGDYRIIYGNRFEVSSDVPFLHYTENNIWHVVSDPERKNGSDAVVMLPKDLELEFIKIKAGNAGIYSAGLCAGTAELELKRCRTRFRHITARRVIISAVHGNNDISLEPSIGADISCGFGYLKAELRKNIRGYYIESLCGAGSLVIDGVRTGRNYKTGNADGIRINARCGLGNMIINRSKA
ncbi:MAG: hypothetical protein ACI4DP_05925 [Candidatus Ornithomonoglobus sp.]